MQPQWSLSRLGHAFREEHHAKPQSTLLEQSKAKDRLGFSYNLGRMQKLQDVDHHVYLRDPQIH